VLCLYRDGDCIAHWNDRCGRYSAADHPGATGS
jgi:hypothetical protein